MSVERRGKAFRVRYRDENDSNRSRSFQSRAEAQKFDRKIHDLKAAGELHLLDEKPAGLITLADYCYETYWPSIENRLATADQYARHLDKRIIPKWGSTRLRDLKPGPIEAWATQMVREVDAKGRRVHGDAAIRKALMVLQAILTQAVRDEEIPRNPLEVVRKPKAPRKRTPVAITPLHVERMRAHMLDPAKRVSIRRYGGKAYMQTSPRRVELERHRDAALLSVLAYSGPRPSEALVARWEQVGEKTITYYPGGKRGAKERYTRLLGPLASDLRHWRLRSPQSKASDLIFGDWPENRWTTWRNRIFTPAAKAAGLPDHVVPRDLRGSFESLLIWSGEDVLTVAREIGHQPSVALDTYGRTFAEFDSSNRRPLEDVIVAARAEVWGKEVRDVG